MDNFYLQAVRRKLKKQGKSDEEVDAFIKNLTNPNKNMEDETLVPSDEGIVSEPEASEVIEDESEVTGTAVPAEEGDNQAE